MKPPPFVYHAPRSVEEAVAVLAEVGHDGKVLAGGQSLIPLLNMRLASPGHLVDINRVEGLSDVTAGDGWVRVGALVRHRALERSTEAYAAQPVLRQALLSVAHPAIRNRGTSVGSITHADAAGELPAILALTNGVVEVAGAAGGREIRWSDFFLGALETSLAPEELAVAARFGCFVPGTTTAFLESARRSGDYALAGVAVALTVSDGVVSGARASFVSLTDVPAVLELGDVLGGVEPDSGDWDAALEAVVAKVHESVDPQDDIHASAEYRRMLGGELTRRALRQAATPTAGAAESFEPSRGGAERVEAERAEAERAEAAPVGVADNEVVVNGSRHIIGTDIEPRRLLSDYLRHDLGLTGTHVGCEHGVCGACTVLVDGQPMRSCLMFAVSAQGHEITTVEGLGSAPDARPAPTGESMNPAQQAFTECHGLQCGFCTPGFLTTVTAYLDESPAPTAEEARDAISGNLCRCTGYQNIVKSVLRAAEIRAERRADGTAEPAERHTASSVAQGGTA